MNKPLMPGVMNDEQIERGYRMTLSDGELIERVAGHDEAAFEMLCANYAEPLRRHLLRMLRSPDTAEDLLQETLLRVWTHAEQWDGRGAVRAWLFRIATSVALNALRTAQRRPQAPITLPSDSDTTLSFWLTDTSMSPQEAIERSEERDRLRSLVARLPEEKREVLRMVHGDEMAISEVAHVLGIPSGTVRSRLHYATRQLAREWHDDETMAE
jgi:RNA polymerase sigma-70 factor (ECF subfamily)